MKIYIKYASVLILLVLLVSTYFVKDYEEFIDEPIPGDNANVVFASALGMIPNDIKYDTKNAELLIDGWNSGKEIIIDDKYYIGYTKKELTVQEVYLNGTDSEEAQLLFNTNRNVKLLNAGMLKTMHIKNIKFTNYSQEKDVYIIFSNEEFSGRIDDVYVEKCSFEGNISLFRLNGDLTINPDDAVNDFGITNFVVHDNEIYNTRLSFIKIVDIPIESASLTENEIYNFDYIFFYIGVTNEAEYKTSLSLSIKSLLVENNIVICNDSWWAEANSGLYYAFVLFEGEKVEYNFNYVEGMKSKIDIALYDAYLSANQVIYTNNTWKNNICFAPNKRNNALLKSKGSKGGPIENKTRLYDNNTFIVEEEYADRLNMSEYKDYLWVEFISLTSKVDSYTITNNTIDVYDIRFPRASMEISEYVFENNTIHTKFASGNFACIRNSENNIIRSITIKNNHISIDNVINDSMTVLKMISPTNVDTGYSATVEVVDNDISAPLNCIFRDVYAKDLDYQGNQLNTNISSYKVSKGGNFLTSTIE